MAAQPPRRTANREAPLPATSPAEREKKNEAAPDPAMEESVELSETETKALPKIGITPVFFNLS